MPPLGPSSVINRVPQSAVSAAEAYVHERATQLTPELGSDLGRLLWNLWAGETRVWHDNDPDAEPVILSLPGTELCEVRLSTSPSTADGSPEPCAYVLAPNMPFETVVRMPDKRGESLI